MPSPAVGAPALERSVSGQSGGRGASPAPRSLAPGLSADVHAKALQMCKSWDKDGSGSIDRLELVQALRNIYSDCKDADIERFVQSVDLNGDGSIQYEEFLHWLCLPPGDRLCFEDTLREMVAGKIGTRSHMQRRDSGGALEAATPAGLDIHADRVQDVESMNPGLERELFEPFSHPAFACFEVVEESASREGGLASNEIAVLFTKAGSSYAGGRRASSGECSAEKNVIHIDTPTMERSHGIEQTSTLLETLAQAYHRIFQEFCHILGAACTPTGVASLRLAPVPITDLLLFEVPHSSELALSAVALALTRIGVQQQELLVKQQFFLCVSPAAEAKGFREALVGKVKVAATVPRPTEKGRLSLQASSYDWIMKENDAMSRLWRLQTFMQTHRAISRRGYELSPKIMVSLTGVAEMVAKTKVQTAALAEWAFNSSPGSVVTEVVTPDECGQPAHLSVMELAQVFAAQGKKVAAVNAASAYKPGGGVSSGGRHALEEAWCITSSLYRSLMAVDVTPIGALAGAQKFHQHIPTEACIVSPGVEVFREPTCDGYGFLSQPASLCCVLSVAMFNRNPCVQDSPLDSPGEPAQYVDQTKAKLRAVVASAIELGAEVLVIPDVGCGIFQNDPHVAGGCLGAVLRKYSGHLRRVVLASGRSEFNASCRRAFQGEDPRDPCPQGAACRWLLPGPGQDSLDSKVHAARFAHPGGTSTPVDVALVALAANPLAAPKPMCRYGEHCRTRTPQHLAQYAHPEPSIYQQYPFMAEGPASPCRPEPAAAAAAPPGASPAGPLEAAQVAKPVCVYGRACNRKNPAHFKEFAHPWLEGETAEQEQVRKLTEVNHEILSSAKEGHWVNVKAALKDYPDLVNKRPESRNFALIHFAANQIKSCHKEIRSLVQDFGADLRLMTRDGQTVESVLCETLRLNPATNASDKQNDQKLQWWLQEQLGAGAVASIPSSGSSCTAGFFLDSGQELMVSMSQNRAIEGDYAELAAPHFGYKVFQKKRASDKRPEQSFLFYSGTDKLGWVFALEIVEPVPSNKLQAYLGKSICCGDPSRKAYGEDWRVWVPNKFAGGQYVHDFQMKIHDKATLHIPEGHV